ncbi:MAG: hypothetical protein RLO80_01085 [Hyphomonas sp.]
MQLWRIYLEHPTPEAIAGFISDNESIIFEVSAWFLDEACLEAHIGIGDCLPGIWARHAYWRPEEIAALSLGKNPTLVNEGTCSDAMFRQDVAQQFLEVLETIRRGIDAGELFERTKPWYALSWLQTNKLDYPEVLADEVARLGGTVFDWRNRYERAHAYLDQLEEALANTQDTLTRTDEDYQAEIRQMQSLTHRLSSLLQAQRASQEIDQARIADLEYQLAETHQELIEADGKKLRGKLAGAHNKLSTLQQTVAALIRIAYTGDPTESGSTLVTEILNDLALNGVKRGDETLRDLIHECFKKTGI